MATAWRRLDVSGRMRAALVDVGGRDVDVLALGKAASTMEQAVADSGVRVRRRLVVTTPEAARPGDRAGDHPIVGERSLANGRAVIEFVEGGSVEVPLVIALSGGASALATVPVEPLDAADLLELWRAALRQGTDIGDLNRLRASASWVGGGALAAASVASEVILVTMVDNVVSGPDWVGSGPATRYAPSVAELEQLLESVGLSDDPVGERWRAARRTRDAWLVGHPAPPVRQFVVATPDDALALALEEARERGYVTLSMGARVVGDVADVAEEFVEAARRTGGRVAVLGAGEVTVRVEGSGRGGRSQEFALRAAHRLGAAGTTRAVAVSVATDGRDHEVDVGGLAVAPEDLAAAVHRGVDVARVLAGHDTHDLATSIGTIVPGGPTGWNLCDVYGVVIDDGSRRRPRAPVRSTREGSGHEHG